MTVIRRTGWLLAAALLVSLLQSFLRQPVSPVLLAAVVLFALASAWRPFPSLLVLAGLGPMAAMIMVFGRGDAGSIVLAEVSALAFLAGWTGRQAVTGDRLQLSPAVGAPALLLATAAAASAVVHTSGLALEMQAPTVWTFFREQLAGMVLHPPGSEPIVASALFACGTLLLVATAHLTAADPPRRTAVLRMLVLGATAAASLNLLRLMTISLQRGDGGPGFLELLGTIRVNVHYADRNAAGSYFALALLCSAGLAGSSRWLFLGTAPIIAAGLWVSGSRFALAAVAAALVGGLVASFWYAGSRTGRRVALAVLAALILVGAAAYQYYPAGRNIRADRALDIRLELAAAGFDMIADHPVFGVGLGRFYMLSGEYAGDALRAAGFARENAHNNFIQIGAELGLAGLLAFVVLLAASAYELARGAGSAETRWLGAGLVAYLFTCLGGHPLLVADAAFPFWIALGLAAAPQAPRPSAASWWRYVPVVLGCLLIASIWPRAGAAIRNADLSQVSEGLSKWQHDGSDYTYRWAGGRSTFYVPSDGVAVKIPLRNASADRRTIEVRVLIEGAEVNRVLMPADDQWRVMRVMLKPDRRGRAFTRFDLVAVRVGEMAPLDVTVSDTGGAIRVGRPEIER